METRKPIVWIDMDDTICHYKKHYYKCKIENPCLEYPQSIDGFFLDLEPINGAKEGIVMLQDRFDVKIATRPSYKNPMCYTEKRLWLEKHYGLEFCQHLNLIEDKGLLLGEYLVDDVWWGNFKGKQILFENTTMTWNDVVIMINKLEDDRQSYLKLDPVKLFGY